MTHTQACLRVPVGLTTIIMLLFFSSRLPQTDTLVHRRKRRRRRKSLRREPAPLWIFILFLFLFFIFYFCFSVWELRLSRQPLAGGVCIDVLCLYVQCTCYICSVEWHSMTRHQRSSGLVWLDFPVSPHPSTHLGRLCWRSHAPQTSRRWWGQSSRLGDDSLFRRLPSNLAVQRRRRQAVKETRKPLVLASPPSIYVCGLYKGEGGYIIQDHVCWKSNTKL